MAPMSLQLGQVLACPLVQPWQNISLEHILLERILEVAHVAQVRQSADFEVCGELLSENATDDFLVGNLFGFASAAF